MNRFISCHSVFLPQKPRYDHFSRRQFPFFCHLLLGISLCLSLSAPVLVGLFSCLLFCVFSSCAGFAVPQKTPPAQSLGVREGICSFLPAAAGPFRSTETSSHREQCLQHSGNVMISHFKHCHSVSSFHFLIGDRSIHESLRCKVSSSYRSAVHVLQERNNSYHIQQLENERGFFFILSGNDSLYIMFPSYR